MLKWLAGMSCAARCFFYEDFMHLGRLLGLGLAATLLIGAPVLAQPADAGEETGSVETPTGESTAKAGSTAAPVATSAAAPASAPTTMATPPPAAGEAATEPGMDGQTYAVRLRDLQQRIDELKEHP